MNDIKVVHVKRSNPPWGQPGDVYIGRASYGFPHSKWHNPFTLHDESQRMDVIKKYERYLFESGLINDICELVNAKRLGCWCAPKPCHGDILVKYIDMYCKRLPPKQTQLDVLQEKENLDDFRKSIGLRKKKSSKPKTKKCKCK